MFDLQWYNALVQNCFLNPKSFRLIQGLRPVDFDSEFLWSLLDTTPSKSDNHFHTLSGSTLFSANYGAILQNLDANLPLVKSAQLMWDEAGGDAGTKAYDKTIEYLKGAINRAPGYTFTIVSDSGSTSDLSTTVRIQHLMTFRAAPLSKLGTFSKSFPALKPWYNAALLDLAQDSKGHWNSPSNWSGFFGRNGSMLQQCTGLIVADGIVIETTARAHHTNNNTTAAKQVIEASMPSIATGLQTAVKSSTNDKGEPVFSFNSPPGNLVVLGVNVEPVGTPVVETQSPGLISVKNQGAFVARFSIEYVQSGKTITKKTSSFPVLVKKTIPIPADASDIVVRVEIATFISVWSIVTTQQFRTPPKKAFKLTGTTFKPECKELES